MATLRRNRYIQQQTEESSRPRVGRCAIRVSYVGRRGKTDEFGKVEQEFYSPDSQSDAAAHYFKQKGIEYDAETSLRLKDLDRRAKKEDSWRKREGLVQHLADAQRGLFTDIAFYKVSRLARNPADAFKVAEEFLKFGVTVHFVRDSLPPLDTTNGMLMLAVASTMAKAEAENLADNCSDAILQRWKKGKPHGPPHPWLKKVKNDYFIDEERFPIERRVIEIILQHRGNREAVRALRAEGIKTVKGCEYVPAHISRYVNETYIKNMLGVAVSEKDDAAPNHERFEIPNAWPPLISQAEADALRILHGERQARRPKFFENREWGHNLGTEKLSRHPASGVIFCSICGHPLKATAGQRSDNGKKYGAYFCDEGSNGNPLHKDQNYLQKSKEQVEDAILRACYVEAEMPPEPDRPYKPPVTTTKTGLRSSSKIRADILAWGREYGQVPDSFFRLRAADLERELRQAEEAEEELERQKAQPSMDSALGAVTNQEVAKRILITSLVEEAIFPYTYENHDAIKIKMKSGRVYACPVHRPTFKRDRKVYRLE